MRVKFTTRRLGFCSVKQVGLGGPDASPVYLVYFEYVDHLNWFRVCVNTAGNTWMESIGRYKDLIYTASMARLAVEVAEDMGFFVWYAAREHAR